MAPRPVFDCVRTWPRPIFANIANLKNTGKKSNNYNYNQYKSSYHDCGRLAMIFVQSWQILDQSFPAVQPPMHLPFPSELVA